MNDVVARLAYARSVVTEREASLAEAETELRATVLGKRAAWQRENLLIAKEEQAAAETEVREQAMGIFAETGNKTPHPAVKVRIYAVLEYKDEDAVNYAREHLPAALKLDRRIFTRAAKAVAMNFMAIRQEPRATIARDLDEYLPTD